MDELADVLRDLQTAMGDAEVHLARRMGLSPRDLAALTAIAFAAEPPSPGAVGRRLGITAASATDLIDRLQRAGHVARAPHPDDRRRIALSTTDSAVGEVLAHLGPLLGALRELSASLDDAERAAVVDVLRRTVAIYDGFARGEHDA